MKLHDLIPNPGSRKVGKRKGQGGSAGQGKTAGRGTKGEGSRAGQGGHLYRQGGALPFYRRLPFRRGEGFTPPNQVEYNEINLEQLAKFPAGSEVTPEVLLENKMLHKSRNPVVILGSGEINVALTFRVQRVTKSAREKIEAAGGSIEIIAV
ncbi:MAG: 50S ribosomal protein L15 [Anaerolineaceae bacterium]|nr:50S ribosomal protein L15 [Anaerolineaceae bacterium]